jgi:hypothetical protein
LQGIVFLHLAHNQHLRPSVEDLPCLGSRRFHDCPLKMDGNIHAAQMKRRVAVIGVAGASGSGKVRKVCVE